MIINLRRAALVTGVALAVLASSGCVASTVVARTLVLGSDSARVVTQPAKAQLIDGSIVILPDGFRIDGNQLVGSGWRFGPTLRDSVHTAAIPTDSIAGVVTFRTSIDAAKSVGMTGAAIVIGFFALTVAVIAGCAYTRCLN